MRQALRPLQNLRPKPAWRASMSLGPRTPHARKSEVLADYLARMMLRVSAHIVGVRLCIW